MASPSASPTHSNLPGVLWALTAVGLFTFIYIAAKLSGTGASALQVMWLRFAGGLITCTGLMFLRGGPRSVLPTSRVGLHVARASAGAFGSSAAVFAASHMPVASASAIGLLDGLFVVILGLVVLHEKVSVRQWCAILVSLAGAVTVLAAQGAFGGWDPAFGIPALSAAAGALLVAVESILIKSLVRTERALTVLFYVNLIACALLAIPAALTWVPLPGIWWLGFIALGPLAIAAQYCNIRAFRVADASVIGPVRYTWVVYGALCGAWFFGDALTPMLWAGIALVLLGGGWLALLRTRAA